MQGKMAFEIVGREQDLASVQAFIGEAEGGTAALVLEGEAGIGKSTLWLSGVRHANERGLRVLSSRPAEAERGLAHVGLGDLFDGVLDEFLPALPPTRRRALEAALLLEDAPAEAVDPRALGIAVRNSLQLLAEDRPVLLAIDDLQWFDAASAGALAFALRRLASSEVRLLLARRLVERAQRSEIEQTLGADRVLRIAVGPLRPVVTGVSANPGSIVSVTPRSRSRSGMPIASRIFSTTMIASFDRSCGDAWGSR